MTSTTGERTLSLKIIFSFWLLSNLFVVVWLRLQLYDKHLPSDWKSIAIVFNAIVVLSPIVLLAYFRRYFRDLTHVGLLVCCCLAVFSTLHEANLLRVDMQTSLDQERLFLHSNRVEAIIRPLISAVVSFFVAILGDDKILGIFHQGGTTYTTHIALNYMFDSAAFLAAFSLATVLLSPISSWLCLLTVALIAQTAPMVGRMGNVFLAGGFFWQLFLLTSKRYVTAIVCGVVICFLRTDVVFATAFAVPAIAWFERRWPSSTEWWTFLLLIGFSLAIPETLILLNPQPDFVSFLVAHGDYFTKIFGNIAALRLAVGLACPMLAVIIVSKKALTKTMMVVIPPALIYLGIVFLIADFTETRLLGPSLGALAFVFSEIVGGRLACEPHPRPICAPVLESDQTL